MLLNVMRKLQKAEYENNVPWSKPDYKNETTEEEQVDMKKTNKILLAGGQTTIARATRCRRTNQYLRRLDDLKGYTVFFVALFLTSLIA